MWFKISLKLKKTLRRKKPHFPEKAEIVADRKDTDYTNTAPRAVLKISRSLFGQIVRMYLLAKHSQQSVTLN